MFLSQFDSKMTKKQKTIKTAIENNHTQLNGNACLDHWDKQGVAGDSFFFTPDQTAPGSVAQWRKRGTAQQMSDGTFEFVTQKDHRSKSKLLKKLAHGRLSETQDGALMLTIKVSLDENVNFSQTFLEEAALACDTLRELY